MEREDEFDVEYMSRTGEELRHTSLYELERADLDLGFFSDSNATGRVEPAFRLPVEVEPDLLLITTHLRHCSEWYHSHTQSSPSHPHINNVGNEGKFTVTMPHTHAIFPVPKWVLPPRTVSHIVNSSLYNNVSRTTGGYEVVDATVLSIPTAVPAALKETLPEVIRVLYQNAGAINQRCEQDEMISVGSSIGTDAGAAVVQQTGMEGETNMLHGSGTPHIDLISLQQGIVDANAFGRMID